MELPMGQLLVVFTPAISLATPSFQQSFLLLPGGVGRNLLLRQFVISSSGDKKDPPPTFDGEYEENLAIHPVNVSSLSSHYLSVGLKNPFILAAAPSTPPMTFIIDCVRYNVIRLYPSPMNG